MDPLLFSDDGELSQAYDKRDDFYFDIVNYPFKNSNIPIRPAYGVYVSWLIALASICTDFQDFSKRHNWLFTIARIFKNQTKDLFLIPKQVSRCSHEIPCRFSDHINRIISANG